MAYGVDISTVGDVLHALVHDSKFDEASKQKALDAITEQFGFHTPIKELAVAAQTAVQQNADLKKAIAEQEAKFNARIDGLLAAFEKAGINPAPNPTGDSDKDAEIARLRAQIESSKTPEPIDRAQQGMEAFKAKETVE
jgi:hypothetical protein